MNSKGTYKVLGVRALTESTYVLRVERNGFEFVPGQCVNIGLVKTGVNREYSTYSGVQDKHLEFLIKEIDGGAVSRALIKLKKSNRVSIFGAYGLFTIQNPEDKKKKYTFIGTGTGIAPFHSYVRSYPVIDYQILHGIRTKEERYDYKDYEQKRYIACLSRERGNGLPREYTRNDTGIFYGRITDYLKQTKIDPGRLYYLCGNSEMINDVYDILREAGVGGSNIITEVFF